jgi:4-amino-4-deoxy-L-arabinose transferase-like glycosyltransferase
VLFPGTKAGVEAVVLLNATLLLGVGTVIMTPDSPLLFFWTATLWAMARIAAGGPGVWWLAAGVFGGFALDSKYTALLLWVGVGLWALLVPAGRSWLRRWQPWAACAIGFLLFAPVLGWNGAHGWAGFVKQGGRVEDWRPARAAGFLAELIGGQIGLATPLVWALCMAGLLVAVRRSWQSRDPGWSLLAALSLLPVLVFMQHAIGDRVQGNWPAIIYPALAVAAGGLLPSRRWWIGASALGFAITALAYVQAATGLVPLPPRLDPIAMRLAGWDNLAAQVRMFQNSTGASYVAADGYALASELAWWLPADARVAGADERWKLTTLPAAPIAGKAGLLVRDARRTDPPDPTMWTSAQRIGTATRGGMPGGDFAVYRVTSGGDLAAMPAR